MLFEMTGPGGDRFYINPAEVQAVVPNRIRIGGGQSIPALAITMRGGKEFFSAFDDDAQRNEVVARLKNPAA